MFTGAWKLLIDIIYNITGSMCLGVYIFSLLTVLEILSISVIIGNVALRIIRKNKK